MRLSLTVSSAAMWDEAGEDSSPGRLDAAGRPVRQIELCDRHAEAVIARERMRGFEIFDRREWR